MVLVYIPLQLNCKGDSMNHVLTLNVYIYFLFPLYIPRGPLDDNIADYTISIRLKWMPQLKLVLFPGVSKVFMSSSPFMLSKSEDDMSWLNTTVVCRRGARKVGFGYK